MDRCGFASNARASHVFYAAELYEFKIFKNEKKKCEKKFIFRKLFEHELEREWAEMIVHMEQTKISITDIYDKIGYILDKK